MRISDIPHSPSDFVGPGLAADCRGKRTGGGTTAGLGAGRTVRRTGAGAIFLAGVVERLCRMVRRAVTGPATTGAIGAVDAKGCASNKIDDIS